MPPGSAGGGGGALRWLSPRCQLVREAAPYQIYECPHRNSQPQVFVTVILAKVLPWRACIAAAADPEVETGNSDPMRLNRASPRAAEIPWLCLDSPESFITP